MSDDTWKRLATDLMLSADAEDFAHFSKRFADLMTTDLDGDLAAIEQRADEVHP